jgi:hypothetical protein
LFVPAQRIDVKISDSIRNHLFAHPGSRGLDLASIDMLRGRDHGVPGLFWFFYFQSFCVPESLIVCLVFLPLDYFTVREKLGLGRLTSYEQITADRRLSAALSETYQGQTRNLDPWLGILAEDKVAGSLLGLSPNLQVHVLSNNRWISSSSFSFH